MKVAIVHDYLNQAGGAERVVAVLHRMFPRAPIFTTLFDPQEIGRPLADADVRVSWMRRLPNWRRNFRSFMPLYPLAVRSFDLSGYDVVITSSSAFAKGVRVPREALHLCYCYTPMRWAWSFDRYTELSAMSSSAKLAAKLTLPALRASRALGGRHVFLHDTDAAHGHEVAVQRPCVGPIDWQVVDPCPQHRIGKLAGGHYELAGTSRGSVRRRYAPGVGRREPKRLCKREWLGPRGAAGEDQRRQ